jgi:transcriptional regulator with XRE-family HTH domain
MTTAPITPDDGAALSDVVATRIRGLMAEKRLTQADVSRALNVGRSGVSDRLTGVKPVNLNELPALAELLGTSIDYLLGLTNDRSPRRATAGGGSMFVLPERTSGLSSALRACRDSNPKPSDP